MLTLKHFEHTIEIRAARADKAHVFSYQLILLNLPVIAWNILSLREIYWRTVKGVCELFLFRDFQFLGGQGSRAH